MFNEKSAKSPSSEANKNYHEIEKAGHTLQEIFNQISGLSL